MAPILRGCLCCDLKVGTIVIGSLHLINGLVTTLSSIIMMIAVSAMATVTSEGFLENHLKELENSMKELQGLTKELNSISKDLGKGDTDYQDVNDLDLSDSDQFMKAINEHANTVLIWIYIVLALSLLKVVTSSMVISGARNDRRGLLLPFVFEEILCMLLLLGSIILIFVLLGGNQITGAISATLFIGIGLEIYTVLVVISQYQALGVIRMHEDVCMK